MLKMLDYPLTNRADESLPILVHEESIQNVFSEFASSLAENKSTKFVRKRKSLRW
ncbi:MAG: hypothetical protein WAT21_14480 [Saprospiraceae bacterium]